MRDALVPINRKWNIAALLDACRAYPRLSNAERITFEYVMLKGVNDSDADARRLVKLIAGIPAKINLIPFNPWPGAPYERSDPERIEAFGAIVNRAGYASPVRTPRGEDIMAACGQLKSASERARRARGGDGAPPRRAAESARKRASRICPIRSISTLSGRNGASSRARTQATTRAGDMNERTWLLGDAEHPHDDQPDDRAVENNLWTRRSALALTAGFFAVGAAPARAAFVQPRSRRAPTTSWSPSRTGCWR